MKRQRGISHHVAGLFGGIFFIFCLAVLPVMAGEYPTKPIKLIVPYPPGGGSDIIGRIWADHAEKILGQPVIVVNKTGGGGVAGTAFAAHARKDGYTLFLAQAGPNIVGPLTAQTPYSFDSFVYIARFMVANCGFVANVDAKWDNIQQFIEAAKAAPGKYKFAGPGVITWVNLAALQWENEAGIQLKHVDFQGGGPAVSSILGGHTDISFLFPASYIPQLKGKKMKLLALGQKSDAYPDVPSLKELGFKGDFIGAAGIGVVKGAPKEVIEKIAKVTQSMVKDEHFIQSLHNIHATPAYMDGKNWTKSLSQQYKSLEKVVTKLGIKK